MQTKHTQKSSDVLKEATANYDMPSRHVSADASFEGFAWNQTSFCSVVKCFVLSGKLFSDG